MLASVAIAQPLLDLLGRQPQFLVAHDLRAGGIGSLAAGLVLVPGLLLAVLVGLAGAVHPRLGRLAVGLVVTGLASLVTLAALRPTAWLPAGVVAALAVVAGAAAASAYARRPAARLFLLFLSPVLVIIPAVFFGRVEARGAVGSVAAARPLPLPPDDMPPIMMVVFDEFPLPALLDEQGEIDAVRYPAFADLAAVAHWYPHATTVHSLTQLALPALLTGRYPEGDGSPAATVASYPENLLAWLGGDQGVFAYEPVTRLAWSNRFETVQNGQTDGVEHELLQDLGLIYAHRVLPQGWTTKLPSVSRAWRGFASASAPQKRGRAGRMRDFIAALEPGPGMRFLHGLLPHDPWQHYPSGRRYTEGWAVPGRTHPELDDHYWADDPKLTAAAYQRLLLQVGFADRLLGEVLATLREQDWFDSALVIVTADHGISMRPGSAKRGTPSSDLRSEVMPIPLLIKEPFQAVGRVDRRNAELIDLPETVADVLGVSLPWSSAGRSLLAPASRQRPIKRMYVRGAKSLSEPVEMTYDGRSHYEEVLAWKAATFGSGATRPDGLFRFGPHAALVGRRVAELPMVDDPVAKVAWLRPDRLEDVDPDDDPLPTHIRATLHSHETASRYWAIAVEGVVQAVSPSHRLIDGRLGVSAILPETGLHRGRNWLEAYWVEGSGDEVVLHAATVTTNDAMGRAAFDALPDLLLRADGDRGFADLAAGLNVVLEPEAASGVLVVEAGSVDPQITFPQLDLRGAHRLGVAVALTSPVETEIQLFYRTDSEPRFFVRQMRSRHLTAGDNQLFFEIESAEPIRALRLDPGRLPGRYRLRSLEIRGDGSHVDPSGYASKGTAHGDI